MTITRRRRRWPAISAATAARSRRSGERPGPARVFLCRRRQPRRRRVGRRGPAGTRLRRDPALSAGAAARGVGHARLMGCLLYDPINIRYATDVANMQVWCLHNCTRYAFVADRRPGRAVRLCPGLHICANFPLVDEIRPANAWFYMYAGSAARRAGGPGLGAGDRGSGRAHGGGNRRLAVDNCEPVAWTCCAPRGSRRSPTPGGHGGGAHDQVAERCWRCGGRSHACEAGIAAMWRALGPASPRTALGPAARGQHRPRRRVDRDPPAGLGPAHQSLVPGMQRPGDRGRRHRRLRHRPDRPLRLLRRFSRSWVTPGRAPTAGQRDTMPWRSTIEHNLALLRPGLTFHEFTELSSASARSSRPGATASRPRRRPGRRIPDGLSPDDKAAATGACSSPA